MACERELRALPLSEIDCRTQVRETIDNAGLDALAKSLAQVGLLQPIFVRSLGERWVIVDGERRYRAALKAGWPTIPALVERESLSDGGVVQRQLVCNVLRADLSPIETARAIDRLMKETPCKAAEAATMVSLSPATVSKLLALLTLPKELQERVHGGLLAASTAYEIAKTAEPNRRAELIASASAGTMKRDVAAGRSRPKAKRTRKEAPRKDARATRLRILIAAGSGRSLSVTGARDLSDLITMLEQLVSHLRTVSTRPGIDLAGALAALASESPREGDSDVRQAG